MSIILDGSTDGLYCSTPVTAFPFSISLWLKTANLTDTKAAASVDVGSSGDQNSIHLRGSEAGDYVAAASYGSGWGLAYTSSGVSSATWHHVLAVFSASNSRAIYIDGGSKGTDATDRPSADSLTWFTIGGRYAAGIELPFEGNIAEVGVWSSALSDANAVSLAAGALPTEVDSGNLEFYRSLESGKTGGVGSALTDEGTPTYDSGDHPTMLSDSLVGTTSLTFGSSANLSETFALSGTSSLAFDSSAALTQNSTASVEGIASITFSSSAVLVRYLTGDRLEKAKRILVAVSNDSLYYEDII